VNAAPLPVWKRVAVFLIFTAVGPLAGVAVLLLISLYAGGWKFVADLELAGTFLSISFLTSIAYFIAFAQAALTGLVAAFSFSRRQLIRFWPVIAASVFIAAAFLLIEVLSDPVDSWVATGLVIVHVGSALLCYLLANLALWPFRNRQTESA
jgi:hypothetical protein